MTKVDKSKLDSKDKLIHMESRIQENYYGEHSLLRCWSYELTYEKQKKLFKL